MQLEIAEHQDVSVYGGSDGYAVVRVAMPTFGADAAIYLFAKSPEMEFTGSNSLDRYSNHFSSLSAGIYIFYVEERDSAGNTIAMEQIVHEVKQPDNPNANTPNGTWLRNDCNEANLQEVLADGNGGERWGNVLEYNSPSCPVEVEEPVEEPTPARTIDCFRFEDAPMASKSFTASYSVGGRYWVSDEHDYLPDLYLSNQKRFASFQDGKLYRHNDKNSVCKFYNDKIYSSSIDAVFPIAAEAVLHSISWEANAVDVEGQVHHDETFDSVIIYNNAQCSGEVSLKRFEGMRDVLGVWRFNDFIDMVRNRNAPFMKNGVLIPTNIKTRAAWFNKSLFVDKFFIVRLIHHNQSQNNLYIYKADVIVSKSVR